MNQINIFRILGREPDRSFLGCNVGHELYEVESRQLKKIEVVVIPQFDEVSFWNFVSKKQNYWTNERFTSRRSKAFFLIELKRHLVNMKKGNLQEFSIKSLRVANRL